VEAFRSIVKAMRYLSLCLLLAGCFADSLAPKMPAVDTRTLHANDPCWQVIGKYPLKPPAQPGDTAYVWAHIAGCSH
jgi:hypothetical protein